MGSTDVYAQESEKGKEKSSPHPKSKKWKCKMVRLVKSKEYKICRPKKWAVVKRYSLCNEKFESQKELNAHTELDQNYKVLCSAAKCVKLLVV